MDGAIRAPDLLARALIERRDEFLFFVVVDDDDEIVNQRGL